MSRPAQHTRPDRRTWTDRATGLLSLLLVLVLVVGIPAALIALRGNPLPDAGTDLDALVEALTRPDDGSLFLAALTWIAWLGWASFTLSVAVEALAQARGLPSPRLPVLGPQQRAASALVAAVTLLFAAPLLPASPALAAGLAPAPVSADASSAAGQAADVPGAPESGSTTMRSAASAAPTPSLAPRLTHVVQPGDSLWQIAADRLGDGARYTEIAQLNYDRVQSDGQALTADHWLRPGWQLALPGDAAAAPTSRPVGAVVVEPGDTLWAIAADQLGDGSRYPEIAAASAGVVQDDGGRLTDPDLIRPGWTLTVPGITAPADDLPAMAPPPAAAAAPAADGTAPTAPSEPGVPEAAGQADRALAPATRPSAAPTPTTSSTDSVDVEQIVADEAGDMVTVRTAAGVGALLAAGLLGLLAAKRARQQRRRRPGQRIAMPPPDLAPAELDLRLVEDPAALARVGQALRTLSVLLSEAGRALPPLRLVRLSGQDLELYLAEPDGLPAPFAGTGDPTVWTLSGDAPLLSASELAAVPAPYPSLVTVGHDLDGAHVLVDLEHVGELAVDGEQDSSVAVLAAIAAELATSTWAEDLQVTLVGCLPALPAALGTGRVRHVATLTELLGALEHRAADVRAALAADGLPDLQHARTFTGQRHGHAWTPEIVLLAGPVPPVDRARLDAILQDLPQVGLAAVTTTGTGAPSEWTLTLDRTDISPAGTAVLSPLSLALRPQRLTSADLGQLLGLLAVADLPAGPEGNPGSTSSEDSNEPAVADLGRHLTHTPAADGRTLIRLVPPAEDMVTPPEPTAAELDETVRTDGVEETEPAATDLQVVRTDGVEETAPLPPPPAQTPRVAAGGQAAPLIQLLGPVELLRPRGTVERSKRRQLTEIAAYLALHPGLDHAHLSEAIWPGAAAVDNTRNTALSKLRKWMGTDDRGVDYVPRVLDDGYRLHPDVRSDWHLWLELLPDGPQAVSTEALASALELVKGKPLAGTNPRRYAWAERHRQTMISAIVDAAHELARRALLDADATLARSAAAVGLQADPGAELLWRDALKAEWLAGDLDGLTSTADRLSALADELGDDLEPDTVELLSELLNRPKRADAR